MISAYAAMNRCLEHASRDELEHARLWLDIARELREGLVRESPNPVAPQKGRSCAKCGQLLVVATDPVEGGGVAVHDWSGRQDCGETTFKDERPGEAIEGAGDRCSSCGYFLRFDETRGVWVHTRTDMQVCPVGKPGPDDTVVHGFATPE